MKLAVFAPFLLSLSLSASGPARAVPDLSFKDLEGHKQKLSALRGNIVVLSFWATWCGPCQEELPRLSKLDAAYTGKPVRFIAISIDESKTRDQIASFLSHRDIHLAVWTGASAETMESVGLTNIVPSTLVLDEEGRPITRITGEARDEDVRTPIDWLLSGRQGTAPAPVLRRMSVLKGHSRRRALPRV